MQKQKREKGALLPGKRFFCRSPAILEALAYRQIPLPNSRGKGGRKQKKGKGRRGLPEPRMDCKSVAKWAPCRRQMRRTVKKPCLKPLHGNGKSKLHGKSKRKRVKRRRKPCCRCVVGMPQSVRFTEKRFPDVHVSDQPKRLPAQMTALHTVVSYAVINRGSEPAHVVMEISPNAADFMVDTQAVVKPQSMVVVVPNRFLKWTRLSLFAEAGKTTVLDVYFQAQTIA